MGGEKEEVEGGGAVPEDGGGGGELGSPCEAPVPRCRGKWSEVVGGLREEEVLVISQHPGNPAGKCGNQDCGWGLKGEGFRSPEEGSARTGKGQRGREEVL